jgi:hypothetical protein
MFAFERHSSARVHLFPPASRLPGALNEWVAASVDMVSTYHRLTIVENGLYEGAPTSLWKLEAL